MPVSLRTILLMLLGALGLYSGPVAAQASSAATICSNDFVGESTRPDSVGCVDVLSWSWSAATSVSFSGGGGPPVTGTPNFSDLVFVKYLDSASEDLIRLVSTGSLIKGVITFKEYRDCGSSCTAAEPYLTISLRDSFVTSVASGGSPGGGASTESVSLFYTDISYCYRPVVKDALGPAECFAFSRSTNSSIPPF